MRPWNQLESNGAMCLCSLAFFNYTFNEIFLMYVKKKRVGGGGGVVKNKMLRQVKI